MLLRLRVFVIRLHVLAWRLWRFSFALAYFCVWFALARFAFALEMIAIAHAVTLSATVKNTVHLLICIYLSASECLSEVPMVRVRKQQTSPSLFPFFVNCRQSAACVLLYKVLGGAAYRLVSAFHI